MTQDYVALMDELKTGQRDKITVTPETFMAFSVGMDKLSRS